MNKQIIKQLEAKKRKLAAMQKARLLSDNEVAENLRLCGDGFTSSFAWKSLAAKTLLFYGWKCMKCGRVPTARRQVNVDHVKPRKTHPELALDPNNLQVLCAPCNKLKGNKHCTDYRP